MLTSITPLGERGRRSRWSVTVTAFLVGSAVGGALLGGAAGALGGALGLRSVSASARLLMLVGASLLGAAIDLALGGSRLPGASRQVNEDWLGSYRGWVYGVGFGLQLGLGVVTVVSASAVYLAFLGAALTASPPAGALIGAGFGVMRAAPLFTAARVDAPARLLALGDRLRHWDRPARIIAIAAQAVVALAILMVGLS